MNITDLIAELLQQGQVVELPGIGTLDSVTRSPHHDEATRTYYPATREIVFRPGTSGDNSIVKTISERECVGMDVAQQMWANYTDALQDKLNRSGDHTFGDLGTLSKRPDGYGFQMKEGIVIEAGGSGEKPIAEVRTYSHADNEDPFAQFEEVPEVTVVQKIEPKSAAPAPRPSAARPSPAAKESDVSTEAGEEWQENLKKLDDLPKSKAALKAEAKAEKARLKAEAKAEKERAKMRKRAHKAHNDAERRFEEDRDAMVRREAEEKRRAEEELRNAELRAEEERLKAEKDAEAALQRAEQKAHEERVKAEKRAAALAAVAAMRSEDVQAAPVVAAPEVNGQLLKEQQQAEQQAAKDAERRLKEEQKQAKAEAKEQARREKEERKRAEAEAKAEAKSKAVEQKEAVSREDQGEQKEKKSRKWIVWLLLLLLLLLGGIAGWHCGAGGSDEASGVSMQSRHFSTSKANQFTFNTDMLEYGDREISRNSSQVCLNMSDYINDFLSERGYRNARTPLMDRVRQYADGRMGELMGTRFAAQRFIPYDDYIYQTSERWLHRAYSGTVRNKVQGELMDQDMLGRMLDEVVNEYGIHPDAEQRKEPVAMATESARQAAPKAAVPAEDPVYVYVEKKSKQGFDIVAGFYLNKATAAKMTARLHELGCDAYIIEKNDMYYVSMGSAPTRTKAEALYNHIKGWYDGDIVIKQLD